MQYLALYAAIFAVVWVLYVRRRRRMQREHAQQLQQSLEAGLAEPPSLHPVIDPLRCLGSSSCVSACPEDALGIVNGKAVLVNAAACIGHGACHAACPVDAIQLVFGTEKRGIDIPNRREELTAALHPLVTIEKLHESHQRERHVPVVGERRNLSGIGCPRGPLSRIREAERAIEPTAESVIQ